MTIKEVTQTIFNSWYVYYMNNDGKKEILKSNLRYFQAVKLYQWYNTNEPQLNCEYSSL
jgi:hypothetical protein